MKYLDMMKKAKSEGVASEKAMWKSVEGVDEILCVVKEEHPEMYMSFMRDQHEALYGPHYDKHFAEMDVDKIRYTNAAGEKEDRRSLECRSDPRSNEDHAVPVWNNTLGQIRCIQLVLFRYVCGIG